MLFHYDLTMSARNKTEPNRQPNVLRPPGYIRKTALLRATYPKPISHSPTPIDNCNYYESQKPNNKIKPNRNIKFKSNSE